MSYFDSTIFDNFYIAFYGNRMRLYVSVPFQSKILTLLRGLCATSLTCAAVAPLSKLKGHNKILPYSCLSSKEKYIAFDYPLYRRIICAKLYWNRLRGSGEESTKMMLYTYHKCNWIWPTGSGENFNVW